MLVVALLSEMLESVNGMGNQLLTDSSLFETADVFSIVILLGFIGFILDRLTLLITRKGVFWQKGVQI
jgi:ABC-type nitrate/sulfonate/bicarbonate transport system permease component